MSYQQQQKKLQNKDKDKMKNHSILEYHDKEDGTKKGGQGTLIKRKGAAFKKKQAPKYPYREEEIKSSKDKPKSYMYNDIYHLFKTRFRKTQKYINSSILMCCVW